MRLVVARLAIRSNSFSPARTRASDVLSFDLPFGVHRLAASGVPEFVGLHRALAALPGWRADLVRSLSGPTAGPLAGDVFEGWLRDVERAARSGQVDAIFLALSGACQAEGDADADLTVLRRVRAAARRIPVVATFAITANIGAEATYLLDGACGWRGDGAADGADAAARAVGMLAGTVSGATRPVAALAKLPSLLSSLALRSRLTAASWPGLAPDAEPSLLDASAFAGFAWGDCAHAGAAALVWTDRDTGLARELAAEMADRLATMVPAAVAMPTVADAVASWRRGTGAKPLALLDVADDPAEGGLLDTPGVIADLVAVLAADPTLGDTVLAGTLHDAGLVCRAMAVQGGGSIQVTLGAGKGRQFGPAVKLDMRVAGACPGLVVLVAGGLRVVIAAERRQALTLADLDALGVAAGQRRILALKGGRTLAPALEGAGYSVVEVACPGPAQHDLAHLPFRTVPAARRVPAYRDAARPLPGWTLDPRRNDATALFA